MYFSIPKVGAIFMLKLSILYSYLVTIQVWRVDLVEGRRSNISNQQIVYIFF